jgi:hypothetical protein
MTVSELITRLQTYNPNMIVLLGGYEGEAFTPPSSVGCDMVGRTNGDEFVVLGEMLGGVEEYREEFPDGQITAVVIIRRV